MKTLIISLGLILSWSLSLVCFLQFSGCSEETEDQPPPAMVLVPTGKFQMGSTTGDADERPVHTVYVDAFYIALMKVSLSKLLAILHLEELDTQPNMASLITIVSRGWTLAITNQIKM